VLTEPTRRRRRRRRSARGHLPRDRGAGGHRVQGPAAGTEQREALMQWILDHLDDITSLGLQHVWLSGLPLLLGLVISIPVGWLATRARWLRGVLITGSGLLYTIPSLA